MTLKRMQSEWKALGCTPREVRVKTAAVMKARREYEAATLLPLPKK